MSYKGVVFDSRIPFTTNRDALQKARIDDRIGFETRFQTAGNLIYQPEKSSTLYVQQKQRFNKNHATNDKLKRSQDRLKLQNIYEKRRYNRIQNDQKRWNNYISSDQKQQKIRLQHQKVLLDNKRNSNGLPYDPITLNYEKSNKGEQLRKQDEEKSVRRFVRAQNIMEKNNYGYNIITGQSRQMLKLIVPQQLKGKVEEKIAIKKSQQIIKYEPIRDKYDYLDD